MLKRFLLASLVLLTPYYAFGFSTEVKSTASNLLEKVQAKNINSIAVVQFSKNNGCLTQLGYFLADSIASEIVNENGSSLQVIDRMSLSTLLQEHKIAASGILQPENTKKLGKMANVDAIVVGTITAIGEEAHIVTKVVDVETAGVLASVTSSIVLSQSMKQLHQKNIECPGASSSIASDDGGAEIPFVSKFESGGIKFELLGCRFVNNEDGAYCRFLLTSQKTREVTFSPKYRRLQVSLLDQDGNSAVASRVCVNDTCQKNTGHHRDDTVLDANIPVSAILYFPVTEVTTSIKIINFVFEANNSYHNAAFGNIELDPNFK